MPAMTSMIRSKICLFLIAATLCACGGKPGAPPAAATGSAVTSLQSVVLKPGTGAAVANGQIAVVQYTGWLYEASATDNKGKQFDSSYTARQAFKFPLGSGSVIKGWDQGVVGMKVGESRRLVIPPDLAYGDNGAGGVIPPGATLVFDVDLVAIE
jgi:FKBP-type peptidyl-prolyl cis-trans isomerase FkpA